MKNTRANQGFFTETTQCCYCNVSCCDIPFPKTLIGGAVQALSKFCGKERILEIVMLLDYLRNFYC